MVTGMSAFAADDPTAKSERTTMPIDRIALAICLALVLGADTQSPDLCLAVLASLQVEIDAFDPLRWPAPVTVQMRGDARCSVWIEAIRCEYVGADGVAARCRLPDEIFLRSIPSGHVIREMAADQRARMIVDRALAVGLVHPKVDIGGIVRPVDHHANVGIEVLDEPAVQLRFTTERLEPRNERICFDQRNEIDPLPAIIQWIDRDVGEQLDCALEIR